jgi:dihydroxy-acid dehydratase
VGADPAVTATIIDRIPAGFKYIEGSAYLDNVLMNANAITRTLPIHKEGGIAILTGNLAPNGAVVKTAAVSPKMLSHKGPARVFNSEKDFLISSDFFLLCFFTA